MRVLGSLFLLVFLAACTQASQPYRHSRTGAATEQLRLSDGGMMQVLPMEGASKPMGKILARRVAERLSKMDVTATYKEMERPTYRVFSHIDFIANPLNKDYLGRVYWSVVDWRGNVVKEIPMDIMASRFMWDYGDEQMIDKIVTEASQKIAVYFQGTSERDAVQSAAASQPDTSFVVTGITGAPGDGLRSLKDAMTAVLGQYGAVVRAYPDAYAFRLSAEIQMGEPVNNMQDIAIAWIVQTPDGQEIGRARQQNQIPVGSLDGAWGKLAYDISAAAMQGIGNMITRYREEVEYKRSRSIPATTAAPGRRNR